MGKLYDTNLQSLAALRAEKTRRKADAENAYQNLSISGAVGEKGGGVADWAGAGIDLLTSKGWADRLFAIAMPAIKLGAARLEKDVLKSLAKEFVTGYAKWKGLSLLYKVAKTFISKKKADRH